MATDQRRYAKKSSAGTETVYTCPANTRAVINNISLVNTGGGTPTVSVFIDHGTDTNDYYLLYSYTMTADETYDYDGVKMLEASDILKVTSDATGVDVYASLVEVS